MSLSVRTGIVSSDVEVIVVINRKSGSDDPTARGWPANFWEEFAGSMPDFPGDAEDSEPRGVEIP